MGKRGVAIVIIVSDLLDQVCTVSIIIITYVTLHGIVSRALACLATQEHYVPISFYRVPQDAESHHQDRKALSDPFWKLWKPQHVSITIHRHFSKPLGQLLLDEE